MKSFSQLRIVFLGTPDFAVATLDALVTAGANIVAVITVPDKPAGRGQLLHTSAVKDYAVAKNLPLLQPVKLKDTEFLETLKSYHADLQVVVAFRMLPEVVWNMPPMGTINVHASLLPQYRGAAPINHAIMNGETVTGVTTFKLKHEIDTGDILLQKEVAITPQDNAGTLHDKLMRAGADLLVESVKGLVNGSISERPQQIIDESEIKRASKIFTETRQIDWHRKAKDIHNQVRGLSPYPAAFTYIGNKTAKVFLTHYNLGNPEAEPGTFELVSSSGKHPDGLRFAAADGWVYIDELQQEGKKKMPIAEFLKGFRP